MKHYPKLEKQINRDMGKLERFLAYNHILCLEWWDHRGFKDSDNPALAAVWLQSHPKEVIMVTVNNVQPGDTSDPRRQQKMQWLNERLRLAREQGRSVVALVSPANTISITFVPRFDKDNQRALPFTDLTTGKQPDLPPQERSLDDLALRESLSTLLFFEGLRQIVAFGCGVRCPVRSMEWVERVFARIEGNKLPTCCGRAKDLVAFWEAGKKAKEQGWFQPHTWEPPRECM